MFADKGAEFTVGVYKYEHGVDGCVPSEVALPWYRIQTRLYIPISKSEPYEPVDTFHTKQDDLVKQYTMRPPNEGTKKGEMMFKIQKQRQAEQNTVVALGVKMKNGAMHYSPPFVFVSKHDDMKSNYLAERPLCMDVHKIMSPETDQEPSGNITEGDIGGDDEKEQDEGEEEEEEEEEEAEEDEEGQPSNRSSNNKQNGSRSMQTPRKRKRPEDNGQCPTRPRAKKKPKKTPTNPEVDVGTTSETDQDDDLTEGDNTDGEEEEEGEDEEDQQQSNRSNNIQDGFRSMLQGVVDETLEKFSEKIISLVQRPLVQKVSALQNQNRALEAQVKGLSKQIAQLRQECQKNSAPINSPLYDVFDDFNAEVTEIVGGGQVMGLNLLNDFLHTKKKLIKPSIYVLVLAFSTNTACQLDIFRHDGNVWRGWRGYVLEQADR